MRYILASASPRRVEILSKMGFSFEVSPSRIEDKIKTDLGRLSPKEKVEVLSFVKAADIAEEWIEKTKDEEEDILVIGSDTVVSVEDTILEKPIDKEDARRMIKLLEGREHEVFTAVSLLFLHRRKIKKDISKEILQAKSLLTKCVTLLKEELREEKQEGDLFPLTQALAEAGNLSISHFIERTKVFVSPITKEEMEAYISGEEPYDKAGGYAIQGEFSKFIQRIEGDYATVMGLPAGRLYQEIKKKISE